MALINPVNNASQFSPSGATAAGGTSEANQDMFFKLLITQLQNQDPTNPMDGTEFTAQLAQFSQLEKLDTMNSSLDYLQLYLASLNNAQTVDFIGKEITARGDAVELAADSSADLSYSLAGDAHSVTIEIYNQDGQVVRSLDRGPQNAGNQTVNWDGNDSNGNHAGAGVYTFKVTATDANEGVVESNTYLTGVVDSVTFEDGITYLLVGGRKVAVGDIIKVEGQDPGPVADSDAPSGGGTTMEVLRGIGTFVKNAAPLAAMLL
jgi:flagellar basal-body rod modification protein FlgD